jgi:hypothetical protein
MKNPADFVGSVMGQSEENTKRILASSTGKVLLIDEAYMLYSNTGGSTGNDMYRTAVVDTLVAEVQSTPGEDRCVLLLGYTEQMEEMFNNVNPGLARRFPMSDAFLFEDFTAIELNEILELKMKVQGLDATEKAKNVAMDVLERLRTKPNFGNGGDVENLLSKAKLNHQKRQSKLPFANRPLDTIFEPQDFDPDFDRDDRASDNIKTLFQDVVGCEDIVDKLEAFQESARALKIQGEDPREYIPTNFVFKGPPGKFAC